MNDQQVKIIISAIDDVQGAVNSIKGGFDRLQGGIAAMAIKFAAVEYAARKVFGAIETAVKPAYDAVEDFNLNVLKMAAMITSFQGNDNIANNYKAARDYAEQLAYKLEDIDAKTIAGASDLRLMTEEMAKQGVLLDTTNQKQVEAFTNLATAAAVIAQGYGAKEIQVRQEVRALLLGEVRATNQLAQQLDAMVGGSLKQKVELWKREGTIIENIGGMLVGYAAASKDIEVTWSAIGTTMGTIAQRTMREGFLPIYREINESLVRMNNYTREHGQIISGVIYRGFLSVKGVLETLVLSAEAFAVPLGVAAEAVAMILSGLSMLAYAVMPPLVKVMADFMKRVSEGSYAFYSMLGKAMMFDFDGAKEELEKIKTMWKEGGKAAGNGFRSGVSEGMGIASYPPDDPMGMREESVFRSGFGEGFDEEVVRRYNEMMRKFARPGTGAKTPKLPSGAPDEDELKKMRKAEDEAEKERAETLEGMQKNTDMEIFMRDKLENALIDMRRKRLETTTGMTQENLKLDQGLHDAYLEVRQAQIDLEVEAWEEAQRDLVSLTEHTASAMESNFSSLFLDVVDRKITSLGDAAKRTFESMKRAAADFAGQEFTNFLFGTQKGGASRSGGWLSTAASWVASLYGSAQGNVFSGGSVVPFGAGGIVVRPTVFPMAKGAGLMGEDGYEGILPLARTPSGDLGVKSVGGTGGGVQIHFDNIHIHATDAASFQELCARNPGAIVAPIIGAMKEGGQVRNEMKEILR